MSNGKSCPRCKSWEEASPLNWVIVATVSGVVTAVLTAVLTKAWALKLIEQKMVFAPPQQTSRGRYQLG